MAVHILFGTPPQAQFLEVPIYMASEYTSLHCKYYFNFLTESILYMLVFDAAIELFILFYLFIFFFKKGKEKRMNF